MQMEFLLLREVQLVTPAAPTPSIYCLRAKPACARLHTIEARYEAGCWDKEGHSGEVTTTLTTHIHTLSASFSFLSITFFLLLLIFHLAFILAHSISFTHSLTLAYSYCGHTHKHRHTHHTHTHTPIQAVVAIAQPAIGWSDLAR